MGSLNNGDRISQPNIVIRNTGSTTEVSSLTNDLPIIVRDVNLSASIHLDASTSEWVEKDESGRVRVWKDKSTHGRNFVQPDVARRPIHNLNSINGLGSVDFDGSNDYMYNIENILPLSTHGEIWIVFRTEDIGQTFQAVFGFTQRESLLNALFFRVLRNSSNRFFNFYWEDENDRSNLIQSRTTQMAQNTLYIVRMASDNNKWTIEVNGLGQEINIVSGLNEGKWTSRLINGNIMTIGGHIEAHNLNQPFDGKICEFIIYNGFMLEKSAAANLTNHLANKWGVTLNG